jgi:mitochondrial chaperone BCS1
MDVHVRLDACGAHAMRELAERYVGDHEMLDVTEESIVRDGAEMTPAEVGAVLLRNRDEPEATVTELAAELKSRREADDFHQWEDSELSDWSPTKKGRKGLGWESKVRILGRLRSLTKSDSVRRCVQFYIRSWSN